MVKITFGYIDFIKWRQKYLGVLILLFSQGVLNLQSN